MIATGVAVPVLPSLCTRPTALARAGSVVVAAGVTVLGAAASAPARRRVRWRVGSIGTDMAFYTTGIEPLRRSVHPGELRCV